MENNTKTGHYIFSFVIFAIFMQGGYQIGIGLNGSWGGIVGAALGGAVAGGIINFIVTRLSESQ